ncbi:hypothetical protein E2C01_059567 [Portunus trituberculatus]|uniref:Uncharacterized protein n=1 Tax=Portunus trituberculatus TaxID=210409 RepID=A0A5B7H5Q1_PORTR|nr:hypothetical protein [Portunus trituberculatus]
MSQKEQIEMLEGDRKDVEELPSQYVLQRFALPPGAAGETLDVVVSQRSEFGGSWDRLPSIPLVNLSGCAARQAGNELPPPRSVCGVMSTPLVASCLPPALDAAVSWKI